MFMKKKKKKGIDANYKEMIRFDKLTIIPNIPEVERAYFYRMRDGAASRVDWKKVPEALWPEAMHSEEVNDYYDY